VVVRPVAARRRPNTAAALDYLRRRRQMLVRLATVARTRRRWETWERNQRLPPRQPIPVTKPTLDREALDGLHAMLTEELARLDGRRRPTD
jgi:hypothetical protein